MEVNNNRLVTTHRNVLQSKFAKSNNKYNENN